MQRVDVTIDALDGAIDECCSGVGQSFLGFSVRPYCLWQSSEQQNSQQFTLAVDAMMEGGELSV